MLHLCLVSMNSKIGSLNLCLGLPKKELVRRLINEETELVNNIHRNQMNFPGFIYESEINDTSSRVGCYLK